MSTVVHLEEKLCLLYFPTVITLIISDMSALWMVQIKSSFKGRQRQSNYTPAQLKQLINLSAAEGFEALNKMTWYFFIIIPTVAAVQNCFCRHSSSWHHRCVKSPSPLFRTTRWWLWRAKCRGTAAALLAKIFLLRLLPAFGRGRGGGEESRKIPRRRNICVSARPSKRYPTASEEKWLFFFFFSHWAFFRRLASLPSTKWSCQFVFPPHQQEPLGVRKQSRRGLRGTRAQKGKMCVSLP